MSSSLPTEKFDIVYADPPWEYRGKKQFGFAGDAELQYPCMKTRDICALPVDSIAAEDCLLYLWTTGPLLPDAFEVMHAWDFEYVTIAFIWDKMRTNPGYYTMSQGELCLVGKSGKIPQPRGSRNEYQWFYDHMPETLNEQRTAHSKKPATIRNRITAMHPTQSKIELFAREPHDGWTVWGNEVAA